MLALGATQPYSRARIATFDGFYFANESNSLKMSVKTLNNYEQLIELITPEFYDVLGVYIVGYSKPLTTVNLQPVMTKLNEAFNHCVDSTKITNNQLRRYLNTINNIFLFQRILHSTGNNVNMLADAYAALIMKVRAHDKSLQKPCIDLTNCSKALCGSLPIEKGDCMGDPIISKKAIKMFGNLATKGNKETSSKDIPLTKCTCEANKSRVKTVEHEVKKMRKQLAERRKLNEELRNDTLECLKSILIVVSQSNFQQIALTKTVQDVLQIIEKISLSSDNSNIMKELEVNNKKLDILIDLFGKSIEKK